MKLLNVILLLILLVIENNVKYKRDIFILLYW